MASRLPLYHMLRKLLIHLRRVMVMCFSGWNEFDKSQIGLVQKEVNSRENIVWCRLHRRGSMPPMSRRSLVTGAHLHFLKPRSSAIHRGRRTYVTTVVQYISGEFLDLAIALPYPLSWPPYASTIILTTVISRLVFTVPFSIWVRLANHLFKLILKAYIQAKRRQWRLEEQVLPLLVQSRDELGKRIAGNLRREKIQRNRDELQKEFNNKFRAAVRIPYALLSIIISDLYFPAFGETKRTIQTVLMFPSTYDDCTCHRTTSLLYWLHYLIWTACAKADSVRLRSFSNTHVLSTTGFHSKFTHSPWFGDAGECWDWSMVILGNEAGTSTFRPGTKWEAKAQQEHPCEKCGSKRFKTVFYREDYSGYHGWWSEHLLLLLYFL